MKIQLYIYLFLILPTAIFAQPCGGLTVNAGADQTVCAPGGSVNLNGFVTGDPIISTEWTPTTGLTNPSSLNTAASVSATTTYTLTSQSFDPSTNLIVNGDFESGNTGFTSDYTYAAMNLAPSGTYTIITSPAIVWSTLPTCDDHTFMNGTGSMLVAHGGTTPSNDLWCQTVNVTPNTDYAFSTWILTVFSLASSNLQFSINGSLLGSSFTTTNTICEWTQFYETWNSGASTTADICIVDVGSGLLNGYAIDDIAFTPICEETDEVTVEVVNVNAVVPGPQFLPCSAAGGAGIVLNASSSSAGTNISYSWTTSNGNIVSGSNTAMPTVNQVGTYNFTITFNDGTTTCTDNASVQVLPDPLVPIVFINPAGSITCNNPSLEINGIGSIGASITYLWTTLNGNIVSGANTFNLNVNQGGTYNLLVTNTNNGCTADASITILEDTTPPTIVTATPTQITCTNSTVVLDGTGSSSGGGINYLWTTVDGNIVSGANTLMPTVDEEGTYQLTVTNTNNGCIETASVNVSENMTEPVAVANATGILTCANSQMNLDGTGSSVGGSFSYLWTTVDGNIFSGNTTLMPTINAPGTYFLEVTNTSNGCTNSVDVTVMGDVAAPIANILPPNSLSCANLTLDLDGSNSSNGIDFSFNWTTVDGNISNNANTLTPEIDAPGTYTLTITNEVNGCIADASVTVIGDNNVPIADAGLPATLDCNNPSIQLNGNNSSQGNSFSYLWTTIDGNISNGATTLTPTIDLSGTYTLTVTNINNGCNSTAEVTINQDMNVPVADAGTSNELTCINPFVTLDGNNSSQGNDFSYLWTTVDGNIFSDPTTLEPTVNAAGTYTLTVTNTTNNCMTSADVIIIGNIATPIADAGNTVELTCSLTNINLDGSNSSSAGSFSYLWTTMDGNIVNGDTTLMPEINSTGTYNILVTNNANGCIANADVLITGDTTPPIADAGQNLTLDCDTPSGSLSGNNSSQGAQFQYLWTTANGNIINGDSSLMPTVDAEGIYNLMITNTLNGCTADNDVEVILAGNLPTVDAIVNEDLDCATSSLNIDATNSSTGANFIIEWTTLNGNFLSGQNTLMPEVDAPGIYTLTIVDNSNSCEASLDVEIMQDTILPMANVIPFDTITCFENTAILDGSGSSNGTGFEVTWTTSIGNIIGNTNDLISEADASGIYTLTVLNTENGCTNSAIVEVEGDTEAPIVDAGLEQTLTCSITTVSLGGNSSQGAEFEYLWTSANGSFTGSTDTILTQTNAPGDYDLLITNTINGCTANSSVSIFENNTIPTADAGMTAELNCVDTLFTLNGTGSTGNQISYLWTSQDGNILNDETTLNPSINAPGIYELTIMDSDNDCSVIDSVEITQNNTAPIANAGQSFELSCATPTGTLDGTNSDVGMDYLWTTADGNILMDEMTLNPSINAAGIYTLTITNPQNGCTAADEIEITQDADAPIVIIENADLLTCTTLEINLNAENSSTGTDFQNNWTTLDGNIISGATTLQPIINMPGTYTLTISNIANNCESNTSILIEENVQEPTADAGEDDFWNCNTQGVALNGNNSSQGNEFTYLWTSQDGDILGDETALDPNATAPGTYNLLVTNTQNGCTAEDEMVITDNVVFPEAFANANQEINCIDNQFNLDGAGSSQGNEFSYLWTTLDGNIVSDETTLMPLINQAGIYELIVTNNLNDCTTTAQVEVFENTTPPTVVIEMPETLNCGNTFTLLDASSSSQGNEFVNLWTTLDGNIQNGETTLIPSINAAGTYDLLITNSTNGCTATESTIVVADMELPAIDILPAEELNCFLFELFLDASNSISGFDYQIQWTTLDGNIVQGDDSLMPLVDEPGTYTLSILNTQNNCDNSASINVSEDIVPPIADAGTTQNLPCDGSGIFLAGDTPNNEPLSIIWSSSDGNIVSGANGLTPLIDAPGTYTLEIMKIGNGCSASDMVTVTQDNLTSVETETTTPDCLGNEGSFSVLNVEGGMEPYLYSIDNGEVFQTEPNFENLASGNYQLVVQDANGCEWAEAFQIADLSELVISLTPLIELQLGESQTINPQINILPSQIAAIQWSPAIGLSCTDCLTPIVNSFQSTNYTVEITDENGCTATASIEILINGGLTIYIPNAFSPNGDGFNDIFMIFAANNLNLTVRDFNIFDRWGEQLFAAQNFPTNDEKFGWDGIYQGKKLNPGVYVYYAELEFPDGSTEVIKGDVLLMR